MTPATGRRARAGQLVRNLRTLHRRAGAAGLLELFAARALPRALSYRRVAIIQVPSKRRRLHPDLHPRRTRRLDADVERFYAQLAASGEPRVPAFSRELLERHYADGHELWTFHVGEEIAHALWVARDRLNVAGFSLALGEGERALEAGTTPPAYRGRGVATKAVEHVRTVLNNEGTARVLGTVGGYNRPLLGAMSRVDELDRLLTVHVASVAGRSWLRAVPCSPPGAALVQRTGLPRAQWIRANRVGPGLSGARSTADPVACEPSAPR